MRSEATAAAQSNQRAKRSRLAMSVQPRLTAKLASNAGGTSASVAR